MIAGPMIAGPMMTAPMMTAPRLPVSTYRLQLHAGFRFSDARAVVGYLSALGITDVYASPFLKAVRGSPHGYDVTDHGAVNPEIGTEEDLGALSRELQRHGMGLILDIVPNHMGIADEENVSWQDVLENGPSSPHAARYDIDWSPPKPDLADKVLLPFLPDQYGRVLEEGHIRLSYDGWALKVTCGGRVYPLAPETWTLVLGEALASAGEHLRPDDAAFAELRSIVTALERLPPHRETTPLAVEERRREKEICKRRLAEALRGSALLRHCLDAAISRLNGTPGDPRSFDGLERILSLQPYRLSHWRVAADEVNYRRFFDIDDLAAIRVERPDVFEAVHALPFRLVREGVVTGFRVDHPDGLFDPEGYFRALQSGALEAWGGPRAAGSLPGLDTGSTAGSRAARSGLWYVAIEKILSAGERLRGAWPVHGTTGYEFLNLVNGIFVDARNAGRVRDTYARFTGRLGDVDDLLYEAKKLILGGSLSSELHVLARRLDRVSEQHRWSRDFTFATLKEALREAIACFPVYRTYVRPGAGSGPDAVDDDDLRVVRAAVGAARRRNPATSRSVYDFLESVLLLEPPDGLGPDEIEYRKDFVLRFQQLTGPVSAKGLEDTAFYRHYPLASINDVGGEPERFGVSVEEFHRENRERLELWPHGMTTTATHDTKRGEDTRLRIDVLSEIPDAWEAAILRWSEMNRRHRSRVDGREVPDANEEYLLYQTLLGAWPLGGSEGPEERGGRERRGGSELPDVPQRQDVPERPGGSAWPELAGRIALVNRPEFVERIERYMEKALKEAKSHTSWINPNAEHDDAVTRFVRGILHREPGGRPANPFLEDFDAFQERVARAGMLNSLSQVILKVASPGVPDTYQGTELWSLTLVDPDNRRPVDFARRAAMLAGFAGLETLEGRGESDRGALLADLARGWRDGRIKLYVTHRALDVRKRHPRLFLEGGYEPLTATGARAEHLCAFSRSSGSDRALAIAGRWFYALLGSSDPLPGGGAGPVPAEAWGETRILLPSGAPGRWRCALSGAAVGAEESGESGESGDGKALRAADIFVHLPVALLLPEG